MEIVAGTRTAISNDIYWNLAKYRHKVFVEQLGWKLQSFENLEQDQFDRLDTVYMISHDKQGKIYGCARLLPTTQPYLLSDVFPQLLNELPLPNSSEIWELSRFAVTDAREPKSFTLKQGSSYNSKAFLQEVINYADSLGIKQLISVTPIAVERLLVRSGFRVRRAGPPININGYPTFACWIEILNQKND